MMTLWAGLRRQGQPRLVTDPAFGAQLRQGQTQVGADKSHGARQTAALSFLGLVGSMRAERKIVIAFAWTITTCWARYLGVGQVSTIIGVDIFTIVPREARAVDEKRDAVMCKVCTIVGNLHKHGNMTHC